MCKILKYSNSPVREREIKNRIQGMSTVVTGISRSSRVNAWARTSFQTKVSGKK